MGYGFACQLERGLERLGDVGKDVGAAFDEVLVGDEPCAPVRAVIGTRREGNGVGGVGDVLVRCACRGVEGERAVGAEVEGLGGFGAAAFTDGGQTLGVSQWSVPAPPMVSPPAS